jgi:LysR family transcriptional regulator for metE and metH
MIERRHLELLVAISELGSLVEAAERLHVTQSALSHQLRELESRLDLSLLNRRTRPLVFTPAGKRLLVLARKVLPQLEEAEKELKQQAFGRSGRLHLAIECHACFQWLMPTLERYRSDWPEVELDLSAGFNFAPQPALRRGELDMVITSDPVEQEDVVFLPLFRYELLLAVAKNSPWLKTGFVTPGDLASSTLITYPVERGRLDVFTAFLDPAGVTPSAVRTTELTPMMIQLVASERGVTILPNWALDEYLENRLVASVRLGKEGVWRTLFAAVRREDAGKAYVEAFLQLARQTSFTHLKGIRQVK